jgi:hypothetical protein
MLQSKIFYGAVIYSLYYAVLQNTNCSKEYYTMFHYATPLYYFLYYTLL